MFLQSINNRSKTIYQSLNSHNIRSTIVQQSFKHFQQSFNNRIRIVQQSWNNRSTMVNNRSTTV